MTRHAQPVGYPGRPASEIDPTGEFERAYTEAAGVQIERIEMELRDVLTAWFRKELQPYASPYLRKDWVEDLLSTLSASGLTIVPAAEKAALQARVEKLEKGLDLIKDIAPDRDTRKFAAFLLSTTGGKDGD
jgi:hypothetical protein